MSAVAAARPATSATLEVEAAPLTEAEALKLDGELSEEVWQRAPRVSGFLQREPNEGAAPSFDTEFRVAYDETHLYVAVRAIDPQPDRIVGHLTRRDVDSPSDWIRVFVDSYRDRRSAFEFGVNAAGVKLDRYWFADGNEDLGWDAVWDVVISRSQTGWQAEFRIPFSQLRFQTRPDLRFGFAVARVVPRVNEVSTWPLVARSVSGLVSQFGDLVGLDVARGQRRLELLPYVKADLQTRPDDEGDPFVKSPDPGAALGLDLKYALAPGLTLTATVNPDFGQVEADPAVVNLSAFETFFPERRPFFLEGSGVFRFDLDCEDEQCTGLFYSRRIGRAPQGEIDVADDGYSSTPAQTTILGATKLTGRVGSFSIGALNALTSNEYASSAAADGTVLGKQTVEPFTSYSVVRASREFADQSNLGFMATATNRNVGELAPQLAQAAYTGGVDGDWRLSRKYRLRGYWAGSYLEGDAEAMTTIQEDNRHLFQRPDASYLDVDANATSLGGHAAALAFDKNGGERIRFTSQASYKTPGFEINDVGFMRRADIVQQVNWLQVRHDRPSTYIRSFRINFNEWAGWNFGGDRLYFGSNVNAHAQFTNNWGTGMGLNLNAREFDDRLTRGGPGGYDNARRGMWAYVDSDDRRTLSAMMFGFYMRDSYGSSMVDVNPSVRLRPTSALTLRAGFRWSRNINDSQWIENVDDGGRERYVFGHLDQKTAAFTFRLEYTLSPTLSLQLYAEPFVSNGTYWNFKELVAGRAEEYEDRYQPYAYQDDPNFRYTSFRTTNVLRWEYRPGSTLYEVWQQGREDSDTLQGFDLGRDFGHVFDVPASNVFLVKLGYWLNR